MSISAILFALATLCFLLATFEVELGDLLLVPLGLTFMAAAFAIERFGANNHVGDGRRD